jgi:hypothetical protein
VLHSDGGNPANARLGVGEIRIPNGSQTEVTILIQPVVERAKAVSLLVYRVEQRFSAAFGDRSGNWLQPLRSMKPMYLRR